MIAYIIRRVLSMIPVLLLVTFFIFSMIMLLPGDPAMALLGDETLKDEELYQSLRKDLGLDRPIVVQYLDWLGRVLTGDLGKSVKTRQPVMQAILERLPPTLEIAILATLISVLIGIPAGIVSAAKPNTTLDVTASFLALAGVAIPIFWLGIMMIYLFSVILRWLPPSGYVPFWEDPVRNLSLMIMPSFALGAAHAAILMRQMRSALMEVMEQEYITTARSKGLKENKVVMRHGLRNAFIPILTILGVQIGRTIGGAVIVETIFAIPGVGRMIVDSIFGRDFPLVQGGILILVVGVMATNLVADILYAYVDPRIRYG